MAVVLKALTAFFQAREAEGVTVVPWHEKLETQVNVAQGDGVPDPDHPGGYVAANGAKHFSFRIPRNGNAKPEAPRFDLTFPLIDKAEGIGSSGWNWYDGITEAVGYDYDSIAGHAVGVGVSDEELTRVRDAAFGLDFVELRRSTSGGGYHLRVPFVTTGDLRVRTATRKEHMAVARCVLGVMSYHARFDFNRSVDCCGQILWHWHRKATKENLGLTLVKAATRRLTIEDLPPNWKAHVEVVGGERPRVRLQGLPDMPADSIAGLTSARQTVPLDATHRAILEALMVSRYATMWEPDHHVIHTHTSALAHLMAEQREMLGLKGYFATSSKGTDPEHPNCFLVPLPNGGLRAVRFGQGTNEVATWRRTERDWATCDFNVDIDLAIAAGAVGGTEDPDGKGYVFDTLEQAAAAAEMLGEKVEVPELWRARPTTLRSHKDGRLIVDVSRETSDVAVKGWHAKPRKWSRVFDAMTAPKTPEAGPKDYDDVVRAMISPEKKLVGFYILSSRGEWIGANQALAKNVLEHHGRSPAEASRTIGAAASNGWWLVNLPFHDEFPGDRRWNRNAPKLRFQPAILDGGQTPHHPGWDNVLSHIGSDLDAALAENEWAIRHDVRTGRDYLRLWIACLLREPFARLPYLFLWGEQNTGKSFFHEAISDVLIEGGVVQADAALTNSAGFNGQLANAVLCYVEETDLSDRASEVYNKIKFWTTGLNISIHEKFMTPYDQRNATHWVQCANNIDACPIFPGDTRIIVIHVSRPKSDIPKAAFIDALKAEAPHFLRTLMDLELPEPTGRLRLPVIDTDSKGEAAEASRNPVEVYVTANTVRADGYSLAQSEIRRRFCEGMSAAEADKKYPSHTFGRRLPADLREIKGKLGEKGDIYVGNIAWADDDISEVKPKLYLDKKTKRLKADRSETGMAL